MRSLFYFLAALLAFGTAWYYYQDVSSQTATIRKLRLVAEDGLVIKAGTVIDEEFLETNVVSQEIPRALAEAFSWSLDDNEIVRINLDGRSFGQDVASGSFLQRAHFFVPQENAFARRIEPGNRAVSIPVSSGRAVENFIVPGARVDVIGTFELGHKQYEPRRLLENVEVMAVGGFDSRGAYEKEDRPDYDTVTVQADAALVEAFLASMEAAEQGMTLVLRNPCEMASDCADEAVSQ